MFAVPTWTGWQGGIFLAQVIPFLHSFDDDMMSRNWWDTWLGKFESLLRRLYWKSVVLQMESTIDGHRMFQWSPTERAAGLVWADEPQPVGGWNRTVQSLFGDQTSEEGAPGSVEKADSKFICVRIPLPLLQYTEGKSVVEISGETVQGVLDELSRQFSGIASLLFGKDRVVIYPNGEDIRFLDCGPTTAVKGGDEVTIIPVIAGGRPEEWMQG